MILDNSYESFLQLGNIYKYEKNKISISNDYYLKAISKNKKYSQLSIYEISDNYFKQGKYKKSFDIFKNTYKNHEKSECFLSFLKSKKKKKDIKYIKERHKKYPYNKYCNIAYKKGILEEKRLNSIRYY